MSTRYEAMFTALQKENRGAFIPFVVVGDPNMETSLEVIRTLAAAGADALELGIPFSDPVADGPVIQAAVVRALDAGATPTGCFGVIAAIRKEFPALPIGILTYANAVYGPGVSEYFRLAAEAGIDSVLAADMPVAEAGMYVDAAIHAGVDPVFIAPPNADDATMEQISRATRGYTYVVTRKGVTGCDDEVTTSFSGVAKLLHRFHAPPPVVGFGISTPDHVRNVIAGGAAGAISGSATVRIMEKFAGQPDAMKAALDAFVKEMKAATAK